MGGASELTSPAQELNAKLNILISNKLTNECLDARIFHTQLKINILAALIFY
jgi:hypothetical protein